MLFVRNGLLENEDGAWARCQGEGGSRQQARCCMQHVRVQRVAFVGTYEIGKAAFLVRAIEGVGRLKGMLRMVSLGVLHGQPAWCPYTKQFFATLRNKGEITLNNYEYTSKDNAT